MRAIRLYGQLARFIGKRKLQAEVANAAEAVRFLVVNFPGLDAHMAERHYKVEVGDTAIGTEELHFPSSDLEEIKIIPVIAGAGVVGRIIAGVALVALSFIPGIGALGVSLLFGVGASLVLGGVAQLLTPVPVAPKGADSDRNPRRSYSFSGIQNVSRQGVPVPICYGEALVGSVVISAGIDFDQVVA